MRHTNELDSDPCSLPFIRSYWPLKSLDSTRHTERRDMLRGHGRPKGDLYC